MCPPVSMRISSWTSEPDQKSVRGTDFPANGTHKTKLIRDWFAKRPRWHVHYTPTSASWINQVERFFALLTARALKRGVFRSVAELETAINAYLDVTNAQPKPFRWTKTANDILASIQRFCLRTLGANA